MKPKQIEYTDADGNEFVLTPYEYIQYAHACTGCVAAGVNIWCRQLPSCTPESLKGKGRHVWMFNKTEQ